MSMGVRSVGGWVGGWVRNARTLEKAISWSSRRRERIMVPLVTKKIRPQKAGIFKGGVWVTL